MPAYKYVGMGRQDVKDDEHIQLCHFSSQNQIFRCRRQTYHQPVEATGLDILTPSLLCGSTVGLTPDIATKEIIRLHENLRWTCSFFYFFASRDSAGLQHPSLAPGRKKKFVCS